MQIFGEVNVAEVKVNIHSSPYHKVLKRGHLKYGVHAETKVQN